LKIPFFNARSYATSLPILYIKQARGVKTLIAKLTSMLYSYLKKYQGV